MNTAGIFVIIVLVAVLIAALFGANVYEQQQDAKFQALMTQRDQALALAREAKVQRDVKTGELDKATVEAAGLKDSLDKKAAEVASINEQLAAEKNASKDLKAQVEALNTQIASEQKKVAGVQAEVSSLKVEAEAKQAAYDELNQRYLELERQYKAVLPQIPVSGGIDQKETGKGKDFSQAAPAIPQPNRLGVGLAVALGMVVLSSGGYVAYVSESRRSKVTVRMTREQIKEYARYQRERGSSTAQRHE